jgi:hypothetical protein
MADKVTQTPARLKQPRIDALQANLGTLSVTSPVNQNGSFEFDRVLKAGAVLKRTRKTKARSAFP